MTSSSRSVRSRAGGRAMDDSFLFPGTRLTSADGKFGLVDLPNQIWFARYSRRSQAVKVTFGRLTHAARVPDLLAAELAGRTTPGASLPCPECREHFSPQPAVGQGHVSSVARQPGGRLPVPERLALAQVVGRGPQLPPQPPRHSRRPAAVDHQARHLL